MSKRKVIHIFKKLLCELNGLNVCQTGEDKQLLQRHINELLQEMYHASEALDLNDLREYAFAHLNNVQMIIFSRALLRGRILNIQVAKENVIKECEAKEREIEEKRAHIASIRNSCTWRVGVIALAIPKRLKRLWYRLKGNRAQS